MRIQNTDDYKRYLDQLGTCECATCEGKHCGFADIGCFISPGVIIEKTGTDYVTTQDSECRRVLEVRAGSVV